MGHDEDLVRWIRAEAPRAWQAARRFATDDAAASDAVQDALLRMLRERRSRAAELDGDEFVARSVRAARDTSRSAARRRIREQRHAMDARDRRAAAGAAGDPTQTTLDEAVEALPEDERELVALRFRDGLSFAAIGTALGLSESSAHRRLERVLRTLRGRLAALGATAAMAGDDARLAAELAERGSAGGAGSEAPSGLAEALVEATRGGAVGASVAARGAALSVGARTFAATARGWGPTCPSRSGRSTRAGSASGRAARARTSAAARASRPSASARNRSGSSPRPTTRPRVSCSPSSRTATTRTT